MYRKQNVILRSTKEQPLPKHLELQLAKFLGFARSGTVRVQLPDGRVVVISEQNIR